MPSLTQDRSAVFNAQRKLWKVKETAPPDVESRSRRSWSEDEPELQRMWSEGLEVQEIADALGRSWAGVKNHVGRNRERLGLETRPSHGRTRKRGTSKLLAKALGLREQLVSDYARGRAQPPLELLERMNTLTGLTMKTTTVRTVLLRGREKVAVIPNKAAS